jgi:hypothetical protein
MARLSLALMCLACIAPTILSGPVEVTRPITIQPKPIGNFNSSIPICFYGLISTETFLVLCIFHQGSSSNHASPPPNFVNPVFDMKFTEEQLKSGINGEQYRWRNGFFVFFDPAFSKESFT